MLIGDTAQVNQSDVGPYRIRLSDWSTWLDVIIYFSNQSQSKSEGRYVHGNTFEINC